jgi:predicted enzyme related to lactoylglutathione lyase
MTKYEPGMFCWIELLTSDRADAQKFYSGVFGWTPFEIPMDGGEPYVLQQKKGKRVGALYQNSNVPPNWMSYVAVESADHSARTAKDLGATLLREPFDVMDLGPMAVVKEPQGAVSPGYTELHVGETGVGGLMQIGAEMGGDAAALATVLDGR